MSRASVPLAGFQVTFNGRFWMTPEVWYGDALEVEYGLTYERWAALPIDEGTSEVISGGMKVLFERGDMLSRHQSKPQG